MKLPRNLSGAQLIKALEQLGYQPARQTGSHVRLTSFPLPNPLDETTSHSTRLPKAAAKSLVIPQAWRAKQGGRSRANESLREFHVNEHHLTIPLHDPLRIGTLAAILADVAAHHGMTRETLITRLFGK
jgi:hypothetical protein